MDLSLRGVNFPAAKCGFVIARPSGRGNLPGSARYLSGIPAKNGGSAPNSTRAAGSSSGSGWPPRRSNIPGNPRGFRSFHSDLPLDPVYSPPQARFFSDLIVHVMKKRRFQKRDCSKGKKTVRMGRR